MMNQQTLDRLHSLRWSGLAEAWRKQMENPEVAALSFDERFSLLVDQHWSWRENQAMARRLKRSKLDAEPCVEDIDFRHPRGLDRPLMRTLISSQWWPSIFPSCSPARPGSGNPGWRGPWRRRLAGTDTPYGIGPFPNCSAI